MSRDERPQVNEPMTTEILEAILEATDNLVVVLDPEGRIVEFNRACRETTDWTPDEIRGRLIWEVLIPDSEVENVRGYFENFSQGEGSRRHVNSWVTKDGSMRRIEWSNAIVRDDSGDLRFVIGTGVDVSELGLEDFALAGAGGEVGPGDKDEQSSVDAESAARATVSVRDLTGVMEAASHLESRERWFEALVEKMTDGFAIDDVDGNLVFVNQALCRMLGAEAEELIGRQMGDYLDPASREKLWEHSVQRSLDASATAEAYELTVLRRDGTKIDLLVSPQRLEGPDGEFSGSFAVLTDISQLKQMEQMRTLMVTAIEQAAETVVITDVDGAIQYVNPAFERTTGYFADEVIGENPRVLKSGEQDDDFYRDLWETITSGQVWSGQFSNIKRDGTLFQEEATISPVRGPEGSIVAFVAVKRDVTAERELTEQLNQAHKLEALGELAGGIAHDFNNLLTHIAGSVDLLRLRVSETSDAADELNAINETVARGADLTQRLLSVAHQQVLEMAAVDLNAEITRELDLLNRVLPDTITVEFIPPSKPLAILGDRSQLSQVLLNLCLNARDAMSDGGTITITASEVTADALLLAANPDADEGRYAKITVEDTGAGMEAEVRERAFDPFFTTKRESGGSGLGLATVYGIVSQHRGMIELDSRPGVGTRFELYFPLSGEAPSRSDSASERAATGGHETILVVEDEERVRRTQSRMLEALGYHVLEAENGRQALEILAEDKGVIDMIFSDVSMPEMGGQELFDRSLEIAPGLAFVFTSGYTGTKFLDRFKEGEAPYFLAKPHTMAELAEIIRTALSDRR